MNRHFHVCGCGTELVCAQPADQCAVSDPFECPSCIQNQIDAWMSRIESTDDPEPEPKETHDEH